MDRTGADAEPAGPGRARLAGDTATFGPVRPDRARSRWTGGVLIIAIWMVFLSAPLAATLSTPNVEKRALGLAAGIAFALVYFVWMLWLNLFEQRPWADADHHQSPLIERLQRTRGCAPPWLRAAVLALMALLALATVPACGPAALTYGVFVVVTAVATLPMRVGASIGVFMLLLSIAVFVWIPGAQDSATGGALGTVLGGVAVAAGRRAGERGQALQRARERMTEMAVAAERERMSRDLHDILGHSLTVIAMKSELAGRLAEMHAPTAVTEINDVERLARQALADVRATINGSRQVTLATEIVNARSALTAAGVDADLPRAVDDVDEPASELFGWVVREGVTNIIRHAGASRCEVTVGPGHVEVCDDGRGPGQTSDSGRGLRGLRERAAAAGGVLTVGRSSLGGLRLRVDVPVGAGRPAPVARSASSVGR